MPYHVLSARLPVVPGECLQVVVRNAESAGVQVSVQGHCIRMEGRSAPELDDFYTEVIATLLDCEEVDVDDFAPPRMTELAVDFPPECGEELTEDDRVCEREGQSPCQQHVGVEVVACGSGGQSPSQKHAGVEVVACGSGCQSPSQKHSGVEVVACGSGGQSPPRTHAGAEVVVCGSGGQPTSRECNLLESFQFLPERSKSISLSPLAQQMSAIELAMRFGDREVFELDSSQLFIEHNANGNHLWVGLGIRALSAHGQYYSHLDAHISLINCQVRQLIEPTLMVKAAEASLERLVRQRGVRHFDGQAAFHPEHASDCYAWMDVLVMSRLHQACSVLLDSMRLDRAGVWKRPNFHFSFRSSLVQVSRVLSL